MLIDRENNQNDEYSHQYEQRYLLVDIFLCQDRVGILFLWVFLGQFIQQYIVLLTELSHPDHYSQ